MRIAGLSDDQEFDQVRYERNRSWLEAHHQVAINFVGVVEIQASQAVGTLGKKLLEQGIVDFKLDSENIPRFVILLQKLVIYPDAEPAASPIDGLILVPTDVAADPRMAGMSVGQDSQLRVNGKLPREVHAGEIMN